MNEDSTQTGEGVSLEIVMKVADETDREPAELEPLYNVVDTEALDALQESNATVCFPYEGFDITVGTDGAVGVEKHQ